MESRNIKYIPQLDHIRAFAAILMVFYHSVHNISYQIIHNAPFTFDNWLCAGSPLSAIIIEGHTAVALFMVLSGFIFTIGNFGEEVYYKKFIQNRLLRTYPLFILLLFVGMSSFPERFNFLSFIELVIPVKVNFFQNNFGAFSGMFWTIIIEWQFYLIFPFLLLFLNKNGVKWLAGIITVFFIMRLLSMLQGGNVRDLSYTSIIGRMDQFIIGMIVGTYYKKLFRPSIKLDLLFIPGLILVSILLYFFNSLGGWPQIRPAVRIIWPSLEGVFWAFFIITYLSISRHLPRFLSKILVFIGTISYSIYLIHFIVVDIYAKKQWFIIFPFLDPVSAAMLNAIVLILPTGIVISILTYRYVEKPFLDLRVIYKKESVYS